ncbi:ABC transporter permease [Pigmentibacter ruber]|uniref:ABC transporter permease n=1 Tax=Pigmentibacter ruber TaxID=2683196 RepID=UPI00131ADAFB|nr:iron ABC transporter permease [Pigmentibacter ruber]
MKLILLIFILIFIIPIFSILFYLFPIDLEIWKHLNSTVLSTYIWNSMILCLSVGLITLLYGVSLAWLITFYQFPLKKFLEWAIILPFVFPSYILAYIYYSHKDKFIELNSYIAAIFIMSLSFYPYVYLFSRNAFAEISPNLINAARIFQKSELKTFWKIIFPLSQPAIFSGTILVCIEVLGDFGTVDFFSIDTLATGIYRTWFGLGSIKGAIQISLTLFSIIALAIFIDQYLKRKKKFYQNQFLNAKKSAKKLNLIYSLLAIFYCTFPILIAFVIPISILLYNTFQIGFKNFDKEFFEIIFRSFFISFSGAIICIILGFTFSYSSQIKLNKLINIFPKFISLGYAIPGSILSIIVLSNLKNLDEFILYLSMNIFKNENINNIFTSSIIALYFAYSIKFSAISFNNSESAMKRVSPNLFWASKILGYSNKNTAVKIYFPLVKSSLITSFILIFLDILKELPATMILRPFNFETVAIKTYNLASDERLKESSPYALIIVILGIFALYFITKFNIYRLKENKDE